MAATTTTPNMNLVLPTVGVQTGPQYATNLNNCLTTIDTHDHTTGYGVAIPSAGLNINADLPFSNNNLTTVRTVRFQSQSAALALASDIGCLYEVGADLYYNDGIGNQVRITQSGSVTGSTGTITGLPSGTASASYVAITGTFVFQSATNTPAYLDGASVLLRNYSANSNALTLSPPAAMASNYGITLPTLPTSQKIMTLDNSGTMSAPYTVDGTTITIAANVIGVPNLGIGTAQIAAQAVTAAKIANATITTSQISATAGILGSQLANATVDLTTKVTGVLPALNGGTGINNSGTFLYGGNNIAITTTGTTNITLPVAGSIMSSGSTSAQRIERAYITISATVPTIASQSGTWISGIVRNSAGNFTITIAGGIFSAAPTVMLTNAGGRGFFEVSPPVTTTSIVVLSQDAGGNPSDIDFYIMVMGTK